MCLAKKIQKITYSKAISAGILNELNKCSNKQYKKQLQNQFYNCCSTMYVKDKVANFTNPNDENNSRYCNSRLCLICNSIKMHKLYTKIKFLEVNPNIYFTTLTVQNCKENELKEVVKNFTTIYRNIINNHFRKKLKIKVNTFYKLECTYNQTDNTYHPHLHCIVEGYSNAIELENIWKKEAKKNEYFKSIFNGKQIISDKAQLTKKLETTNLLELCKYEFKLYSNKDDKGKKLNQRKINFKALLNIANALYRVRTFKGTGTYYNIKLIQDVNKEKITGMPINANNTQSDDVYFYSGLYKKFLNSRGKSFANYSTIKVDRFICLNLNENGQKILKKNRFEIYVQNEKVKKNSQKLDLKFLQKKAEYIKENFNTDDPYLQQKKLETRLDNNFKKIFKNIDTNKILTAETNNYIYSLFNAECKTWQEFANIITKENFRIENENQKIFLHNLLK